MDFFHQTNSSGYTSPTISEQVRKFFPSTGWFGGNIGGIRQGNNGNIYDIYLKMTIMNNGAKTSMIRLLPMHAYASATLYLGLRRIFSGEFFSSGRVVGIKPNYKCKCKFDEDGDIHNYTLGQMQSYPTKQTAVYNKNGKEGIRNNCSDEDDEVKNNNDNGANDPTGNEQESGGDGDSCVDSDMK